MRDSRYRAMTLKDVEQSGADYLALGHVHAFGGVQQTGRTFWAYPGCPEGRGFDELGDKGFLTGTVEPGQVKLTFVPFARRRYQWLTADVTGTDPLEALRRELPQETAERRQEYGAACLNLGHRVRVLRPGGEREALAVSLTPDYGLAVRYDDGTEEVLRSGEVSVRGLYGYTDKE